MAVLTREELIERLRACAESTDEEHAHVEADAALIEYINDSEIAEAYEKVSKWYA